MNSKAQSGLERPSTWLRISRVIWLLLLAGSIAWLADTARAADTYVPPADPRLDVPLDSGWRFTLEDPPDAEQLRMDDSAWTPVSLPHTWNNMDGEDGGGNYHRGPGWYRLYYRPGVEFFGRHLFLKFDGAFSATDVWINGRHVGRHEGGFADFVFDVTPFVKVNRDNVIAVRVNNEVNTNLPPLSADFTFFGGLYRRVHLLGTDRVQISPMDYGSPGVYLRTTDVSAESAQLQVTSLVSNTGPIPASLTVRSVIVDAGQNIVTTMTNQLTLSSGGGTDVVAAVTIDHPHLWNGRDDPYLYHCYVEVWSGHTLLDLVKQPLGFRWFKMDPDHGFFLNGRPYDLHGVSMHQDWQYKGWAISPDETRTNFALLKEIGATALRLSHYEHSELTYELADEQGVVLWSEIPLINQITESPEFYDNAKQQLRELICQRGNHPAVVCWGIFNEITLQHGPSPDRLVSQLARIEAQEDPTRPSTCAVAGGNDQPSNWFSQVMAFNKYFGWYTGSLGDFATWADKVHAEYPNRCIGISEYGAGANIHQHSEDPVPKPTPGGAEHPEEYQNLYHETDWQAMKQRPYLWCKFVWTLTDFASDNRREGGTRGRNDKGLVTYDRQVRKDAFYWYKANWNPDPMVYITGHTFLNRETNAITAKVYANCGPVELFVNDHSLGTCTSTNCIYTWPVSLMEGTNMVRAVGKTAAGEVSDSLVWIGPKGP